MNIMVTGAAGFIGSNVCRALLERGHRVTAIDNLSQGERDYIETLKSHEAFTFHELDIRDEHDVVRVSDGCGIILHLAAYKIPRYSDALDTLTINSLGSESVVKAAVTHRAKIVAASTSDVYGKNTDVPFSEDSNLVVGNPDVKRWSYAISKMFEEQLLFAYHDRHGLDIVIMRYFGGYGPHQNLTWWGGPQSVFINSALDDREIELHGDGQQTRSFTYISDHVDGTIRCIEKPEANNLVFNIGQTQEISIEGLARLIWRLVRGDAEPKLKWIPYSTFGKYEDVPRRVPNIDRARKILGFEPKVGLEDGLRQTIAWQVERRRQLGIDTPDAYCKTNSIATDSL